MFENKSNFDTQNLTNRSTVFYLLYGEKAGYRSKVQRKTYFFDFILAHTQYPSHEIHDQYAQIAPPFFTLNKL